MTEPYDRNPNALDFAAYTTRNSARWLRQLLLLKYPLVLTVFLFEAEWMLIQVWRSDQPIPFKTFFVGVGVILSIPAILKVFEYWGTNLKKAKGIEVSTPATPTS